MTEQNDYGSGPLGDGQPCTWCKRLACDGYCEQALADMERHRANEPPSLADVKKFVQLVSEMRAAQNAYFRHKSGDNLDKSKSLESKVDQAVKRFNERFDPTGQTKLF